MDKSIKKKNLANGKFKNHFKIDHYRIEDELDTTCCFCVKTKKTEKKDLISGCLTNLGIFVLLIGYTIFGALIFLAIEGSAAKVHQRTLATTSYQAHFNKKFIPLSKINGSIVQASAELRSQTVESIWEITVSLNILYKENWTRLASQEIARFQEKLVAKVAADVTEQYGGARALQSTPALVVEDYEWDFSKAFLYSLTVLTTIGFGSVAPRTALGKIITIGYAVIGIPLTLLYLSVVGALLSRIARSIFRKSICCCLCIKCRQCCIDQQAVKSKEKQKINRHNEYRDQTINLQEPYYVRSPSGTIISASQAQCTLKDKNLSFLRDCDSTSCTDTDSGISFRGLSIFAPISLCLVAIFVYIFVGAVVLYQLEGWNPIDSVYFCFMSLSTIGFGYLVPGAVQQNVASMSTVWFCSIYIMVGLALTAMCFNVLHDEIVHRLRHNEKMTKGNPHKLLTPEFLHRS